MKGSVSRPCWNRCGTEIVHRMDGGKWAWVETATGKRHRCPKQGEKKKHAQPMVTGDEWKQLSERERAKRVRGGLSNRDLRRGLRIIGNDYRPEVHTCGLPPWEACECPK